MKLTEMFIELGRPVGYYPKLTRITGGVKETLLLCQLLYWEGKGEKADRWIYKTRKEMADETGLSRYEQETARKNLKRMGFLEEKLAGIPATMHFRVDLDKVNEAWIHMLETEDEIDDEEETAPSSWGKTSQLDGAVSQLVENQPTTWLKRPQQHGCFAPNSLDALPPTITETTTRNTTETMHDDSLRSSSVLGKPSKHREASTGTKTIESVVAEASAKSRKARDSKEDKPRKVIQNAITLARYFGEKFSETFGGVAPMELAKDRALLKKMIGHYGYDKTVEMTDWMFRNWAKFRRECRLTGVPTVGMLVGFRAYLQEQMASTEGKRPQVDTEEVSTSVWGV